MFGAIALGLPSDVAGPPDRRTRTYLAALPATLALATVGTLVAASTAAAVGGMLVVGFLVAFSGVGGPRVAGLANGLQLCYILPCFPPYDVAVLPDRLAGLHGPRSNARWPGPPTGSPVPTATRAPSSGTAATRSRSGNSWPASTPIPPHARFSDDPRAAVRVVDVWAWLHGLADDVVRAERAVDRGPPEAAPV